MSRMQDLSALSDQVLMEAFRKGKDVEVLAIAAAVFYST